MDYPLNQQSNTMHQEVFHYSAFQEPLIYIPKNVDEGIMLHFKNLCPHSKSDRQIGRLSNYELINLYQTSIAQDPQHCTSSQPI